MWPFRRKKAKRSEQLSGKPCPFCGSRDTRTLSHDVSQERGHIKTWRGERFANYVCSACGREFYADEPGKDGPDSETDRMIEDEDELRAAEEELKRKTNGRDDRRFWPSE